jgi:hypothetical protein
MFMIYSIRFKSGARDGYAKLKPTIIASKKKVGDNIKMACEETTETDHSSSASQNGKKEKPKKKQKKKEGANAEANLVERIALDLGELDLSEVSELVNQSGSEEEKESRNKKASVVQALASGAEVMPSEAGKVC